MLVKARPGRLAPLRTVHRGLRHVVTVHDCIERNRVCGSAAQKSVFVLCFAKKAKQLIDIGAAHRDRFGDRNIRALLREDIPDDAVSSGQQARHMEVYFE